MTTLSRTWDVLKEGATEALGEALEALSKARGSSQPHWDTVSVTIRLETDKDATLQTSYRVTKKQVENMIKSSCGGRNTLTKHLTLAILKSNIHCDPELMCHPGDSILRGVIVTRTNP